MIESFFTDRGIYYRVNKFEENRKTLVFLHGLSGSSSSWIEYEKRFEDKYNILNLDLRGHGTSTKRSKYKDYEVRNLAEDVYELVKHLSIEKCILISHSFGTLVAFEFLKNYGNLVEKTVFLSPDFYPKRRLMTRVTLPPLQSVRILDFFPHNPKVGKHIDYSPFMGTYDWDLKRIFVDVSNTTIRVYMYSFTQLHMVNYEEFLSRINLPVLILHGRSDTFFPVSCSIIINEKVKNSRLILLDGDHFILFKKLETVVGEIERFINGD